MPVFLVAMILHYIPIVNMWLMTEIIAGLPITHAVQLIFSTPVQFGVGKRFYVNAFKSVRNGGANMDVLIAIGTTAAYAYSFMTVIMNLIKSTFISRKSF